MIAGAILFKVLAGILVLGVLIFVHELGHFLFAKFFKVGVLEFAIGFGKKVWKKQVGETRYSIGVIPLGGYVRMVGDDPRVYNEDVAAEGDGPGFEIQAIGDLTKEQEAMLTDKSRWLLEKRFWPKFLIVFAGPLFNILFAWFLAFSLFAYYGEDIPVTEAKIGDMFPDFPAEKAGLEKGDLVTHVGGAPVQKWKEFATKIRATGGDTVTLDILRVSESGDTEKLKIDLTPQRESEEVALLMGDGEPGFVIGVHPMYETSPVGLGRATLLSGTHVLGVAMLSVKSVALLVQGAVSPKHISGPISIVEAAGDSAEKGGERLLLFVIFLSVSLAILNLLPIPVLDGGHIVFFTIEAILGRPVSLRVQEYATGTGLVILLCLTLFAVGNDILRLVS
jgi:regulator of sigma E protease